MTIGTSRKSALSLAARASRRLQRGRVARRAALWIWLLALTGFVAAGLVGWWQWSVAQLLESPLRWWGLIVGFYLAEWLVVHMRFGKRVHSYTMMAVPMVVGLLMVAPVELLAASAIAAVVFAGSRRREPLVMLVLLIGRRLLEGSVAVAIFALSIPEEGVFSPTGWLVVLAAVVAAHVVGHVLFSIASWVQGVDTSVGDGLEAYGFGAFVTVLNAGLGMLIAQALLEAPRAAAFAVIPALALFAGFRAYASSRHERGRLKALYEATRDLHASPQLEDSLLAAAGHARDMFEAEFCEIVLELGDHRGFRTIVGPGDHHQAMDPIDLERWRLVWEEARDSQRPFVIGRSGSLASSAGDRRLPISAAMVAPVAAGGEQNGIIIVANPINDSELFSKPELRLLSALAGQVGVAVENGRLEDSLAELTELKAELQHQALHDGLTGLANRSLFSESVFHALQLTRRTGKEIAVLFLDLDDFKSVNDSLGHAAGDDLLRAMANLLRNVCRPEDTVARLGADEFGILLEDIDGAHDATASAQKLLSSFEVPLRVAGRDVPANASIGIAFGHYGDTAGQVLRDADAAKHAAKRDGKGTFRLFESNMHAEVVAQLKLKADLEAAIARQELRLLYQPIVDLEDGRLLGFEALVRWQHSLKGWQNPATFIPFAEETGLINDIGRWVLWEAARRCREWVETLAPAPGEFKVTVNLSARQLDDAAIVAEVERVIGEMGFDPAFLVLEITETAMMNAAPERLDKLRGLGVRLAIDDFGTGYSSLASLHKLSIDVLKIDQVFVKGIAEEDASPFVGTMVGLGQALGLQTIVEGIETQEQLERLRELGCGIGQGFYFAQPLTQSQATQLVERQGAGKVVFDLVALADGYRDRRLRSVP
jgi:diguanylate cyclase (GGDEF)-like protein